MLFLYIWLKFRLRRILSTLSTNRLLRTSSGVVLIVSTTPKHARVYYFQYFVIFALPPKKSIYSSGIRPLFGYFCYSFSLSIRFTPNYTKLCSNFLVLIVCPFLRPTSAFALLSFLKFISNISKLLLLMILRLFTT